MELTLKRNSFTAKSTIGELSIDGKFYCYVLEDVDRWLKQDIPLQGLKEMKVHGKTAIPYGRYEVRLTWSPKYNRIMPQILNVPAYEGIRIHSGNIAEDTEGCLLVGKGKGIDAITRSREAFSDLFPILQEAEKKGPIHITITK